MKELKTMYVTKLERICNATKESHGIVISFAKVRKILFQQVDVSNLPQEQNNRLFWKSFLYLYAS